MSRDVERAASEAQAARLALRRSLDVARQRLSPANLRAGLAQSASDAASAKLKSPPWLIAAGAGLAGAVLFGARHARRTAARAGVQSGSMANGHAADPSPGTASPARVSPALLTLGAALGVGIALERFIPVTDFEKATLPELRPELGKAASGWLTAQVKSILSPANAPTPGVSLLLSALGVASALAQRDGAPSGRDTSKT